MSSVENRLFLNRYNVDEKRSHLKVIDQQVCRAKCPEKWCNYFCPAEVYKWQEDETTVAYLACLECGTCRVGCPWANIEWVYPRGGYGVSYKFG
jgi:ferredoxin like protein